MVWVSLAYREHKMGGKKKEHARIMGRRERMKKEREGRCM
jgi:hypothetical protein